MNLVLHVWRQPAANKPGKFERYEVKGVSEHQSFLEMMDLLNEQLVSEGREPVAFDSDCREGICGTCGIVINGRPHGPQKATTTCQLHMRHFKNGDELTLEPWRAKAFPVLRDLVVDRSAFDRIIQAGGYISARAGAAPEANSVPVPKQNADLAMDAAACIGCGACVASCPNASAMLFTSAKIGHLNLLPQGAPEAEDRVRNMVAQMEAEGFGHCTNHLECEAACPKEISTDFIARMNRQFMGAMVTARETVPRRAVKR
ncbi:MAG TPA: succinate dehydrogenase/fumarate reductase iron-sulfur subunit [Polyangiaceae bacterium]